MASEDIAARFAEVGAAVPRILLPAKGVELEKFATIACDQFSADPDYWREVERLVGGAPSSLRLMLPEAWLKEPLRRGDIEKNMRAYCEAGILEDIGERLVYVRRGTSGGVRRGLLLALDLEGYGPDGGLIRPTEATVAERLPARIEVRRESMIEMPHIMVLIDDRDDSLMSALEAGLPDMEKLYDFELMMGGGRLEGYGVGGALLGEAADCLKRLLVASRDGMLYAMGDGNHSFAAARACWDEIKAGLPREGWAGHPARYCLCEIVNLYDPAMVFEPIHRALLGVDPEAAQREMGFDASSPPGLQQLQPILDAWLADHPGAELEYIHGEDECRALCDAPDRLAVIMPEFDRDILFETVRRDGALARKSFSIGRARDKRYYLECRRITLL